MRYFLQNAIHLNKEIVSIYILKIQITFQKKNEWIINEDPDSSHQFNSGTSKSHSTVTNNNSSKQINKPRNKQKSPSKYLKSKS